MTISQWSTTPASNATAGSINWAEGQLPSTVNDSARQLMADVRTWTDDGGWHNWGHTHTYASTTSTSVAGVDVTAIYHAGRAVRAVGSTTGTIYGKVASSSFATNTTINYTWDSGTLANETLTISVGFVGVTGKPIDVSSVRGASSVSAASETVAGIMEIATTAETTTGTDDARAVTPLKLAGQIGGTIQGYDANTLKANATKTLTVGYATTPYSAGTKSSGTFTPSEANGGFQYATNGGAHTLAPPTNNCSLVIQYTNNASAGTVTTSGFTKVTGDSMATTNALVYMLYIVVNNGSKHLNIVAMQ